MVALAVVALLFLLIDKKSSSNCSGCFDFMNNTYSIHSGAIVWLCRGWNACRPDLLNVNCASTRLVLLFFVTLLDKSRTPAKDEFLLGRIKDLVWQTCSQANSSPGGLQVHIGDLGVMVLQPSGQVVGFQHLVRLYHASICKSWKLQWDSMVESQCLHSVWSDNDTGVGFVDLIVFIFTVAKERRRQCKDSWASKSQQLLRLFAMSLVIFLESALLDSIVDYMTSNDCYSCPLPSRRLSRCDESTREFLSVINRFWDMSPSFICLVLVVFCFLLCYAESCQKPQAVRRRVS